MKAGYRVTVHAFDRSENHPLSENVDGVRIMRYQIGKASYGGKISTLIGLRKFSRRVRDTLLNDPPGLVYCHDADTLKIGVALKRAKAVPFVFDMHDLHHTWVRMEAPNSLLRSLVSGQYKQKMLSRAKHAECIITSSGAIEGGFHRGFAEWLEHHGLHSHVVENRPMPPFPEPSASKRDGWTVGYLGRIRDIKSFELLLASILTMPTLERPHLRIAGDGIAAPKVRRMMMQAVEDGKIEATITGAFSSMEFSEIVQEIDVMYAMYSPQRGNILQGALPVKMFDAASHGVPTVVNDGCLMGEIVQSENIGMPATWNEIETVVNALKRAKEMTVELNHTGEREQRRWLSAMEPVLNGLQ
jgi:glycosyltransferase involved in cell wall biosynthesis